MTYHLYIHSPQVLVTGQVNDSFNEVYPTFEIPIKSVVGDFMGLVKPGMTVIFGSEPGLSDLGRQRIRRVFSDEELLIGRSSQGVLDGEVNVAPNDYFSILDEHRVWSKMPYFDASGDPVVEYKDADLVFEGHGAGTEFYPVANTGPGFAATIDSVTGLITVAFDGGNSFGIPVASNITGYDWDFADGTVIAGGANQQTATVTFPAGFRYISLTVGSAVDSGTVYHTAYCPVYARDPANDTTVQNWWIGSLRSTPNGQQLSLRILSELPRSTYPDGALIMLWQDEPSSAADRSHMKFIGWHHTDSASLQFERTGYLRDTTLECLDVAGKLDALPGLPQIITHAETPANWQEMYRPGTYLFMDYLLRWHSTALEVADYLAPDFDADYAFITLSSDAATIYQQADKIAHAIVPDHILTCNQQGQLKMRPDPILQTPFLRTSTVQATLAGHIAEMRLSHMRSPRVGWIRGSAVVEGWAYQTINVDYTIRVRKDTLLGETMLPVQPLPVDIPSGTVLNFGLGEDAELTADAAEEDTELAVVALPTSIEAGDVATYTRSETSEFIPTVFSIAPGLTPGQGEQHMTVGNKLAQNQGALDSLIGQMYARLNSEDSIIDITLSDNDDLDIDPAEMTWIQLGALATRYIPQRALSVFSDNPRLLPLEVNRQFSFSENGTLVRVGIRAERETSGPLAVEVSGDA